MNIRTLSVGPISANCYLVHDAGRAFVIDPGMEAIDTLGAAVEEEGVAVEAIFLTHGHIDHVCDAARVAGAYDVPVYIHPADKFMLEPGSECPQRIAASFSAHIDKLPSDIRGIADGETVELAGHDYEVVHAPGHSPGCVMLKGEDVVFSGDVLFRGAVGRVDLPYSNKRDMQNSLRGKVMTLPEDLRVLPGHGPATTVEKEKSTNPFLVGIEVVP